jgi:hypothetical protein
MLNISKSIRPYRSKFNTKCKKSQIKCHKTIYWLNYMN